MKQQLELPMPRRRVVLEIAASSMAHDATYRMAADDHIPGLMNKEELRAVGFVLVDGHAVKLTPWFNGWEEMPYRDGWYEVEVAGEVFPFNGYYCYATDDFRQGDIDGQVEHYARVNCKWRGICVPAPGGYGKDRGPRPRRAVLEV